MRQIISLTFLLFVYSGISAQSRIHFIDNFENNDNGWPVMDDDGGSARISGGSYIIYCGAKNISYRFWTPVYIDANNDFSIEVRMKHIEGADHKNFGITWGTKDWKDSYTFNISSSGKYKIWQYHGGVEEIFGQGTAKSISGKGGANVLKIVKKDAVMNYYVNGNLIFTDSFRAFYGTNTGFMVETGMKAEVDYIIVKHDEVKINLVTEEVSKYSKESMGTAANSKYSEIAPVIAPDGKTLYFARNMKTDFTGYDSDYEIMFTTQKPDGSWTAPQTIGAPLNNAKDNVVIAVTPDNNSLLLEGLYNADGSHKSDQGISISYRTETGWSVPKQVVIDDYYNRDVYESFCPTADRKVLVMSVQRDEGYGKKDMYVSFLKEDGTYSKPKNMGPVINSYDNEGTPYIAPDGVTMYFYSYTQPGYGNADIFVSKRLDDTWTKWSTPKNLGTKINTSDWDVYYAVSAKGDFAYLSSTRNSMGNEDIFKIKLRDEEKPEPVVLVEGKVLDKKTNKPIGTTITYENAETGKTEGFARSNPRTGEYKIILPYGVKYQIFAEKEEYFALTEELNLKTVSEYKELKKNLLMAPMEKEETILLQNVNFYATKAVLIPESYGELNRLAATMKEHPTMIIEIHGHTESTPGYDDQLMKLSERRVESVRAYLENKGIAPERIKGKAFGGTKPIADNTTDEGRQKNRRVEFLILSK